MARMARMSSRMRGAGCDQGMEKRLVMCGLIWLPRPKHEPALGQVLQVVGQDGQVHGVAGEGDRDAGPELERLGGRGADGDGQERIVRRLGRPHAVVAVGLCLPGRLGDPRRVEPDAAVNLHAPCPFPFTH